MIAYNLKAKVKHEMESIEIKRTPAKSEGKFRYVALGKSKVDGAKMSLILNEEKALEAIKSGVATKGEGW